jgi:hypothetical protein
MDFLLANLGMERGVFGSGGSFEIFKLDSQRSLSLESQSKKKMEHNMSGLTCDRVVARD